MFRQCVNGRATMTKSKFTFSSYFCSEGGKYIDGCTSVLWVKGMNGGSTKLETEKATNCMRQVLDLSRNPRNTY